MIELKYKGNDVIYFANPNGKINTQDSKVNKFNRVGKLAKDWEKIEEKLINLLIKKNSQEAYALLLMANCGIRIGNEDSAEGYVTKLKEIEGQTVQTYGLTTLLKEHVEFVDQEMHLKFVGKKVVNQHIVIKDEMLVKYGKQFFEENDGDQWLAVRDYQLKRFLKKTVDKRFQVKDFRTLCANCNAYMIYESGFKGNELPTTKTNLNKEVKEIYVKVSEVLGNTPSICKSAYVSPEFLSHVETERGAIVIQKAMERETKKAQKEAEWEKMNAERVAQGLPKKRKPRKKKRSSKKKVK